jgi:hypothetical protein
MNRAKLNCLFGSIPEDSDNLYIGGAIQHELRNLDWPAIWGDSGLVVCASGSPLIDTVWHADFLERCPDYLSSAKRFLPRIKFGTYFNTMLFWCRGYYHWICDVLPRVQRALPHLPPEAKFILPANLEDPFIDAFAAAGVPWERCEFFQGSRPWRVRRLIHVPPVAMTGDHTRESLLSLRESVFRHTRSKPPLIPARRIYIARRQGAERSVVNEAELLPILQERGFEVVRCEGLSFADQVELFRESKIVVGPHGGGFANLVWCEPGTKVFEIFGTSSVRRCYWSICQALGLAHHCAIADEADGLALRIEPSLLKKALANLVV